MSAGSASSAAPYSVLAREEQDDEVGRRVKPGPVALVRQLLDVLAQQPGVVAQVPISLLVGGRLVGVEHALQRRLGVDDDVLAPGQVDDQVGAQRPLVAGERRLLDEVAVAHHPGELDDVAQLHLAPLAARVRLAQRGDERAGLGAQPLAGLVQRLQLRLEPAAGLAPLLVEVQQLLVDPAELLPQRRDELLDRLLALVQIALRLGLGRLQLGPRELR